MPIGLLCKSVDWWRELEDLKEEILEAEQGKERNSSPKPGSVRQMGGPACLTLLSQGVWLTGPNQPTDLTYIFTNSPVI